MEQVDGIALLHSTLNSRLCVGSDRIRSNREQDVCGV